MKVAVAVAVAGQLKSRIYAVAKYIKRAYYRIPLKEIERIADAREVKVKVVGSSYSLAGEFTRKNSHNFQRFLADLGFRSQPSPLKKR